MSYKVILADGAKMDIPGAEYFETGREWVVFYTDLTKRRERCRVQVGHVVSIWEENVPA